MTLQTLFHTTDLLITDQDSVHSQKIILNMVNFLANGKFSYCVQLEEFSLFDSQLINLLYSASTGLPTKEQFLSGLPFSPHRISRLLSRSCSSNKNILLMLYYFLPCLCLGDVRCTKFFCFLNVICYSLLP